MTQNKFWSLVTTGLHHGIDEDRHLVELFDSQSLTAALLGLTAEQIAAFEQMFQHHSAMAHERIALAWQKIVAENTEWQPDGLIGWTMIHGEKAFEGCLLDPDTAVHDFDYDMNEYIHDEADLQGLAPRAYLLKTGNALPSVYPLANDGPEQGNVPSVHSLNVSNVCHQFAGLLPGVRAVHLGVASLHEDIEAALSIMEDVQREMEGVQREMEEVQREMGQDLPGGHGLLADDIAKTRGLLGLLSGVALLVPQNVLQWCDDD